MGPTSQREKARVLSDREREKRGAVGNAGPRGSCPTALLGCGGKESWAVLTCCWAMGEKERDGEEQQAGREERARVEGKEAGRLAYWPKQRGRVF